MKKTPSGSGVETITKCIFYKELHCLDRTTLNEVSESMNKINEQPSLPETLSHVANSGDISDSS